LGNLSPKQENRQQLINQNGNNQNVINNSTKTTNTQIISMPSNKNGFTNNNNSQQNQLINGKTTNDQIIDSDDIDVVRTELVQVRKVLDKERKLRMKLEETIRELEAQLYPSRIKEIAQQVQMTFQPAAINLYHPHQIIQHQPINQTTIKDNETEAASVLISEPQHEVIAETVEIGAEIQLSGIETQDCSEYTNQSTLLTSSHHLNNHLLTITNNSSTNVNIPTTNTFIIQDLTNQTLIDPMNNITEVVQDEIKNKILTSTAYLTTTTVSNTTSSTNNNKQGSKSKNNTSSKSDKNVQNKSKTTSSNQQQHNTSSSTNLNKKVSSVPPLSQSNNQSTDAKKDKIKKSSTQKTQPAAIALPIDVPFIYEATNANNILDKTGLPTTTVTVQIIDGSNLISSIDTIPVNTSTANTAAGRNNNLDTILEAICHLEGDMFGNVQANDLKQQLKSTTDQNGTIRQSTNTRPAVIVSSSNS